MPNVIVKEVELRSYVRELLANTIARRQPDRIIYGKEVKIEFAAGPRDKWCSYYETDATVVPDGVQSLFDMIHTEMYDSSAGIILEEFAAVAGEYNVYRSTVDPKGTLLLIGKRGYLSIKILM